MKGRTALHLERRARVMREHENRHMVGRIGAPPATPRVVIGPAPTGRGKHIATEDPRAEIFRASLGKAVVDAGRADARIAEHALERARRKEPLVKLLATFTERVLFALIRSRTIAVQRNSETIHAQFTHGDLRSTRGSIVRRTSCTRIDERRNPFDQASNAPRVRVAQRPRVTSISSSSQISSGCDSRSSAGKGAIGVSPWEPG